MIILCNNSMTSILPILVSRSRPYPTELKIFSTQWRIVSGEYFAPFHLLLLALMVWNNLPIDPVSFLSLFLHPKWASFRPFRFTTLQIVYINLKSLLSPHEPPPPTFGSLHVTGMMSPPT